VLLVPSSVDAPKLSFVGARRVVLELSPPAKPNGVVIRHVIYVNGTQVNETSDSVVAVGSLKPYTFYEVHFAACTSVGCSDSQKVNFRTLQDGMFISCLFFFICVLVLYNILKIVYCSVT